MHKQDVNDAGQYAKRLSSAGHQVNLAGAVKLWPTPKASRDGTSEKTLAMVREGRAELSLDRAVKMWPTPVATDATKCPSESLSRAVRPDLVFSYWPTPAARDCKEANSDKHLAKDRGHPDQLPNAVKLAGATGGQLSPIFVEWLMGFPSGWTDCED